MNDGIKPSSEQETFWAGAFGDEYTARNVSNRLLASNTALFARILKRTNGIRSILELGANRGMNIHALRSLLPVAEISAVEINKAAVAELSSIPGIRVFHSSLQNFKTADSYDLVFTKGVLIHLAPDSLPDVYRLMATTTNRYVCCMEYYNPTPVEVPYRGHSGKLFKRDFAGEFTESHPEFRLVDYGFVYRRDPIFPQDDITWFLLEKKRA